MNRVLPFNREMTPSALQMLLAHVRQPATIGAAVSRA